MAKHPLKNIRLSEVEYSSVDCGSCWRRLRIFSSGCGVGCGGPPPEGQVAGYIALWAPMLAGSWLKTTFTAVSQALLDPWEAVCKCYRHLYIASYFCTTENTVYM